jgi:AraC-like DNA-binding protein
MTSSERHNPPAIPPEYSNWKDGGCELFPSCLNCPLPHCVEEKPRGKQKLRLEARDNLIAHLRSRGKETAEIARLYRISQRTVQRILKATGGVRHD